MKLLITGAAGFIGYHLCRSLLDDGYDILGIDSISAYYDQNLKKDRLDTLKSYGNFFFKKCNLGHTRLFWWL